MKLRRLGPLTWLVIVMVVIDAATTPALLLVYKLSPDLYELHANSDLAPARVDTAIVLGTLLTMIAFGWWILRAGNNLLALGYEDLSYTPAARIWWFLVPFANLVIPYFAMRELWNASHGKADLEDTPPLVAIWWGAWLLSIFAPIIVNLFAGPLELMTLTAIQSVTGIALAAVAIRILLAIRRVQAAQRGPHLAEVFA